VDHSNKSPEGYRQGLNIGLERSGSRILKFKARHRRIGRVVGKKIDHGKIRRGKERGGSWGRKCRYQARADGY